MKGFAQALLAHPDLVILDTETTDLDGYLVQLAVLRASDGAVLLDTLVNPCWAISPEAQRVHGITTEQVANAPTFTDIERTLRKLLTGKLVAIYNLAFDHGVLEREVRRMWRQLGLPDTDPEQAVEEWFHCAAWLDVMPPYSAWCGEWNDHYRSFTWQRLPGGDHSAIGDCRATLNVLRRMAASSLQVFNAEPPRVAYRDRMKVENFLKWQPGVMPFIRAAWPALSKAFGRDVTLVLEVAIDPDGPNSEELVGWIQCKTSVEEAIRRYSRFEDDWLLDNLEGTSAPFYFNLEFQ